MSVKPFDVIVVGDLNADLILSGDTTPAFGQVEKLIAGATLTIGSSGGIFACGAAKLGLRVALIGKVGDDVFGRFLTDSLAARRIDISGVIVDPVLNTGLTVILSRELDRALLTYPGTINALRYDEINLDLLAQGRHLHYASFFLLDAMRANVPRLLSDAHQRGLTVSLDPNYDPLEQWDRGLRAALPGVDILFPNDTEVLAIAHTADIPSALAALGKSVPTLVAKRGAEGASVSHQQAIYHAAAYSTQVVDTTGAGDSFAAGYVYGYLSGWSVERTLRFACACGSLSTRGVGGTTTQPTLDEALRLIE